jgi:hypothetical protein
VALPRHLGTQHRDAPGRGRQHPKQHRERRRLAGAVAAEERRRRPAPHRKRDALNGLDVTVGLFQVGYGDGDGGVGGIHARQGQCSADDHGALRVRL